MICIFTRSLRGTELRKNIFGPVKCLQIPFPVAKCILCMTAVLGHQREDNQDANTFQSALEIVILTTVRISQCGRQYGLNTVTEVEHFLSLPLCNSRIGLFWYAEPGIRQTFFPGSIERLLPFMLLSETPLSIPS